MNTIHAYDPNKKPDNFKWENKSAKDTYGNAGKVVGNLTEKEKIVRDSIIIAGETISGTPSIGATACAAVSAIEQRAMGMDNDKKHEMAIKTIAMDAELKSRAINKADKAISKAINKTREAINSAAKKMQPSPNDPMRRTDLVNIFNGTSKGPTHKPNKGNESSSSSKSTSSRKRERLEERREDRERRSSERRSKRKSSRGWRAERSDR